MADKYSYYSPEYMKNKKLSDLKTNGAFLDDALTFLKSSRVGYKDEDFKDMTADDVVSSVLEHFRYQTMNEVSMSKDLYFIRDDQTPQNQKEAFGRLMYAFDNAKGEGLFDRGAEKVLDYAGATASAPSTYISAIAGMGSGGAGTAAVQGSKQAALAALREAGKGIIKKSLISGAIDGSVAAASAYGSEVVRQESGEDIGEEYDINTGNVVVSGLLGAGIGAATYGGAAMMQNKGAARLLDTLEEGREASVARLAAATEKAKTLGKEASKTEEGKRLMSYVTDNLLSAIDPKLVKEGNAVREGIFSADLPDGIVGGFNTDTIQRITAASYELAQRLGVQPEKGQRITEFLADNITENTNLVKTIASEYGLTPRQMSTAYAAEISEAARKLAAQSKIVGRDGNAVSKASLEKYTKEIDRLYDAGMSTLKGEDIKVVAEVNRSLSSKVYRQLKGLEDARRMFMTSQPATTMRNNIFSVAMTGIDMLDQVNTAAVKALSGNGTKATATIKGTFDNLAYLTKDQYVADALITMLRQDAPEQLSRVFHDAAISESKVLGDTALAKLGAAANTLNTMSDFVVKRAVIAGSIDRQLKQLGSEELGTSVMDMLKKGTVQQLPDEIIDNAVKASLDFTFQTKFGGKGASTISKKTEEYINFIHNNFFTLAIPFPRYLASQAKFASDYTGLTAIAKGFKAEDIGKALTGAELSFAGYYAVYSQKVHDGTEWNEVGSPDGKIRNGEAAFGPAAGFAYSADLAARIMEGLPTKKTGEILKDYLKIYTGTEFRPSAGLTTKVIQGLEAGNWEPLMQQLTDNVGAFTYPAAVLKDFYGQFDPRSSYIAETRDPTMSVIDLYGINVPVSLHQRITRQLPDFPGVNESFLGFLSSATRLHYQTAYAEQKGIVDKGYDAIKFDVFGDGPVRLYNPIEKQLTGFVGRPPKNALQKEMTMLQIDPFTLYNPYKEKNAALELFTQQKLQGNLARKAETFMQSEDYVSQAAPEKKAKLENFIKDQINEAKADAEEDLISFSTKGPEYQNDYMAYIKGEATKLAGEARDNAERAWVLKAHTVGYKKDSTFNDALEAVENNPLLSDKEKATSKTILYRTYMDWGKAYDKYTEPRK